MHTGGCPYVAVLDFGDIVSKFGKIDDCNGGGCAFQYFLIP